MFGDVLRQNLHLLSNASLNKMANDAFWIILRDIAVKDIRAYMPSKIDSVNAVEIYYDILSSNEQYIPYELTEKLPSNNQERYRVINRNLWTSNAFHPDGLANQVGIKADRVMNKTRKGEKIIYQGI